MFLLGHLQKEDQKRETGILAGEAAIGAFLDTEVFKYAAGRERPFTGSGTGRFFVGGDSFPSTHASVSWAIASVIAHEYPGPLTQLFAYGMAGGVSAVRRFASDQIPSAANRFAGTNRGQYSNPQWDDVGARLRTALDDNTQPSCSAAEALQRQHPFINQTLAQHALALLSRLFRGDPLSYHGGFVNLASGSVVPLRADPAVWKRIRKRARPQQSALA